MTTDRTPWPADPNAPGVPLVDIPPRIDSLRSLTAVAEAGAEARREIRAADAGPEGREPISADTLRTLESLRHCLATPPERTGWPVVGREKAPEFARALERALSVLKGGRHG